VRERERQRERSKPELAVDILQFVDTVKMEARNMSDQTTPVCEERERERERETHFRISSSARLLWQLFLELFRTPETHKSDEKKNHGDRETETEARKRDERREIGLR